MPGRDRPGEAVYANAGRPIPGGGDDQAGPFERLEYKLDWHSRDVGAAQAALLKGQREMVARKYDDDHREEWLRWFMDPATIDKQELQKALQSVPVGLEPWLFVEVRLRVALHEAKDELLPPVSSGLPLNYRTYTADDWTNWDLIELKEKLFFEEVRRRRQKGYAA